MITTNTVKNTAITRGRTRHAGCRVNIHSIHAAARPHRARSMARDPTAACLIPAVKRARAPSSTYGPARTRGSIRRPRSSSWANGIGPVIGVLHMRTTPSETI